MTNTAVAVISAETLSQDDEIAATQAKLKALRLAKAASKKRERDYEAIDTRALVNTWDGGINVSSVDHDGDIKALLVKAGLDWRTLKRPMMIAQDSNPYAGTTVDEHNALLRSDTGLVLDVVGNRYEPINNEDAFSLFRDFLKAGDMTLDTAGMFKEGRHVWGLAKLKREINLKNDKTVGYMMISAPHVQGASLVMKLITKRITCWNSYQAALRSDTPTIRMTHKADFKGFSDYAKKSVQGFNDSLIEYGDKASALLKLEMNMTEALDIIAPIYDIDKSNLEHSRIWKDLNYAYEANPMAEGVEKRGTAWDVFNGVTYYNTHMQSRTAENRLFNSTFGVPANNASKVLEGLYSVAK